MFWKKNKTPEEELREAEERRQKQEEMLDHLKQRIDIEIETAKMRIEAEEIRAKLKNPDAEYRRLKNERNLQKPKESKTYSRA